MEPENRLAYRIGRRLAFVVAAAVIAAPLVALSWFLATHWAWS